MPTNVLVLIHGITPEERPTAHTSLYQTFWDALQRERPELRAAIARVAFVEWGNALPGFPPRPDTALSEAERRISQLVRFDHVKQHPGPNNVLISGPLGDLPMVPLLREQVLRPVREELVQFGLADAVYYCSPDGELAVRVAIYGQVLEALRPFKQEPDVRLHLVTHSLGVTVGHDLLYGLFGKETSPDYLAQAPSEQDRKDYAWWRGEDPERPGERTPRLRVGSFVSFASQLPIFVLRKQALVTRLAQPGGVIDPGDIGIDPHGPARWLVCYDVDDVLGFATRELYGNPPCMRQVQVDSGDFPLGAHTDYWTTRKAIEESAELIARNSR